ncbi:glycosyltransferase family 9 protein [Parachitinimonas caeni]|uniref:Glycosyltransferase family 9 protein n=1 Tax=Parachitinimonas caeni TaxID=3031301 RepID=A0ABT7E295_9NEIS|nr:glycosyltransferase family 9 protein [Parachitinimonas caeni]MDK2126433.1 glycosyltransferase family 9 protein [Parachitinimonas caeni]
MASRNRGRLLAFAGGVWASRLPRRQPANPRRILIVQQLLLGDSIMLAPLLAKLRAVYPQAELVLTCAPGLVSLFAARPWGLTALPLDFRQAQTVRQIIASGPYDLALIPAESRLSWLARAAGARWLKAFAGDPGYFKNWPIDEHVAFPPPQPSAWGDLLARALIAGADPVPYAAGDWPAPPAADFQRPAEPYVVCHVGASNPLKFWPAERWARLAGWLAEQGLRVVFSCGPGEAALLDEIDPKGRHARHAGDLSLPQLWQLLAGARLLISLDTGVLHLAHLTLTPTVGLYGPGSPTLFTTGQYWQAQRERKVYIPDFPCRDENLVFRRPVAWAGNCARPYGVCTEGRCMQAIDYKAVELAAGELLHAD